MCMIFDRFRGSSNDIRGKSIDLKWKESPVRLLKEDSLAMFGEFAIWVKKREVGRLTVAPPNDDGFREIRYQIDPLERGHDYAHMAVQALVTSGRFPKLWAEARSENVASQKALEKSGFRLFTRTPDGGTLTYRYDVDSLSGTER